MAIEGLSRYGKAAIVAMAFDDRFSLGFIGSSGAAVLGGSALFALAMGMGVPVILFGVSAGKLVPRAGRWMDAVKAVFGVAMLGLSIWMLERILPGGVIMLLWGALAIGCAIYLGALERIEPGASGWRRLWKALGVMLLVFGVLEFIGAAAGGDDWQRPLAGLSAPSAGSGAAHEEPAFAPIKSVDDLDRALAAAGQGAMLDFYADWCIECKRMERNTFPEPGVAALMDQLSLLQADVTANDDQDQALMQERFGLVGPPAMLFFDGDGNGMGDFPGLTSRLDYIQDLGVDTIWLLPFYPSPGRDDGYDIADYGKVNPDYGTLRDVRNLIREAHARDLRVITELVFNHTSDQHPWFVESRADRGNPKADWYVWADAKPDGTPPTNWLSIFGGSAWEWDGERMQYYLHNFLAEQPDSARAALNVGLIYYEIVPQDDDDRRRLWPKARAAFRSSS